MRHHHSLASGTPVVILNEALAYGWRIHWNGLLLRTVVSDGLTLMFVVCFSMAQVMQLEKIYFSVLNTDVNCEKKV